jgi:hypothetical protein
MLYKHQFWTTNIPQQEKTQEYTYKNWLSKEEMKILVLPVVQNNFSKMNASGI